MRSRAYDAVELLHEVHRRHMSKVRVEVLAAKDRVHRTNVVRDVGEVAIDHPQAPGALQHEKNVIAWAEINGGELNN